MNSCTCTSKYEKGCDFRHRSLSYYHYRKFINEKWIYHKLTQLLELCRRQSSAVGCAFKNLLTAALRDACPTILKQSWFQKMLTLELVSPFNTASSALSFASDVSWLWCVFRIPILVSMPFCFWCLLSWHPVIELGLTLQLSPASQNAVLFPWHWPPEYL